MYVFSLNLHDDSGGRHCQDAHCSDGGGGTEGDEASVVWGELALHLGFLTVHVVPLVQICVQGLVCIITTVSTRGRSNARGPLTIPLPGFNFIEWSFPSKCSNIGSKWREFRKDWLANSETLSLVSFVSV